MCRFTLVILLVLGTGVPAHAQSPAESPSKEIAQVEATIDSLQNRLVELRAQKLGQNTGLTVETATVWYGDELEKVKDVLGPGVKVRVQDLTHMPEWGSGHYFWKVTTPRGFDGFVFATEVAGQEIRKDHPEAPPAKQ